MSRLWLSWSLAILLASVTAWPVSAADPKGKGDVKPDAKPTATKEVPKKDDAKKDEAKKDDAKDDDYYELYKSFADTVDQIQRNYVKDISRRDLMDAAIKGMLTKLDPYSSYIPPEDLSGFKTAVESQFGGIGIQISVEGGQIKILSPLMDTPAYRAGIRAGDKIVKIEGQAADGLSVDDAVKKLKGEAGTSVTLTFQHADGSKPETATLKREVIQVETVLGDTRGDDDHWDFMFDHDKKIGYIRVTAFSHDTTRDLKKALEKLQAQKVKGLILDLRNNPGGLLNSAIEICDLFVTEGVIVSTEGRNSPKKVWEAHKDKKFDAPLGVLVNRYSASASEIVSACLQDHKRAVIIGERTWGKGSVQNVIELEDGKSALKLTTAGYLRPNGHNIHRYPDAKETDEWGVKPDDGYELKLSDVEFGRMMLDRRERDFLLAKNKPEDKPKDDKPKDDKSKDDKSKDDKSKDDKSKDDKSKDDKSKDDKSKDDKSKDDKSKDDKSKDDKAKDKKPGGFVDRQLQKGLDYLSAEFARAN